MASVSVLALLASSADRQALQNIFSHSKWTVEFAETLQQASQRIQDGGIGVAMADSSLPDGHSWKDLLHELHKIRNPPALIITDRHAGHHLWAEVLNLGGYDLVMKPFEAAEVFRVISLAWLSWTHRTQTNGRAKRSPTSVYGDNLFAMKAASG